MDKKLLALLVIVLVLVISIPSSEAKKTIKECKGGREFWGCESPTKACQRLCENKHLRSRKLKSCNRACHLSCICEPGFLREGEEGECVPEAECSSA